MILSTAYRAACVLDYYRSNSVRILLCLTLQYVPFSSVIALQDAWNSLNATSLIQSSVMFLERLRDSHRRVIVQIPIAFLPTLNVLLAFRGFVHRVL